MNKKLALVLGGGGHFGIAWELGYVRGLFDAGINLRNADIIVGTSAGSQVGALLISNKSWDVLWQEQIEQIVNETTPISDNAMGDLFVEYNRLAQLPTAKAWIEGMADISRQTPVIIPEEQRLQQIQARLGNDKIVWSPTLRIVATSLANAERVVFDYQSGTDLLTALAASSALPGVWPAITINDQQYFDGGSYSMENPDVIPEADKILVLSTGIPVKTPYKINDLVDQLTNKGQSTQLVSPNQKIMDILKKYHNNTVNAELRKEVAEAARVQGYQSAMEIKSFWK